MNPKVLFRNSLAEEGEKQICAKYFDVTDSRLDCIECLVIPRYSCLPYYVELEQDLYKLGSFMLNSYQQHKWIASFEWYNELIDYTPESWTDENFYLAPKDIPYVVKGKTNSRKFQWNTKMFAKNKQDALRISSDLLSDGLICEQGVIYRKYIPLKTLEVGINDLPFTHEFRCFFYKNVLLADGYYWSIAEKTDYTIPREGLMFAQKIANIVCQFANFYVLDIAETETGEWTLIEINDASMSGLSMVNPDILYDNLKGELC